MVTSVRPVRKARKVIPRVRLRFLGHMSLTDTASLGSYRELHLSFMRYGKPALMITASRREFSGKENCRLKSRDDSRKMKKQYTFFNNRQIF